MGALRLRSMKNGKPRSFGRNVRKVRSAYAKRDRVLWKLGYNSYAEYLASPLWKAIRARVLAASPECSACPRKATQVHHQRYTEPVLRGQLDHCLSPVCGSCHKKAEFGERRGKPFKLTPKVATQRLAEWAKSKLGLHSVPTGTRTAAEIEGGKSAAGGWTRKQLAEWGVPWPPPAGWKDKLLGKA